MLTPYLDDLETRIDEFEEEALFARWYALARGEFTGDLFDPPRTMPRPAGLAWPHATINQGLDNFESMVLQQLGECSAMLTSGGGRLLAIRANYGTPILPSLFGVKIYRMEDMHDTLPASWPLPDLDAIRAVVDAGVPDLYSSLAGQALETGERYVELFKAYPKIARHVHIYHPDTQGPMDLAEMLWGSGIFVDSYEEPELLHALLEVITQTYIAYLRAWGQIVPFRSDGVAVHWGMLHRGHIMLRDDSAMNFSPAMYEEFFVPYEQRLLDAFGGGAMHFCGRGDHYIAQATAMRGIFAINMSQPEYNDMETIYQHTVDRNVQIIGLARGEAERALASGRPLHGNVSL